EIELARCKPGEPGITSQRLAHTVEDFGYLAVSVAKIRNGDHQHSFDLLAQAFARQAAHWRPPIPTRVCFVADLEGRVVLSFNLRRIARPTRSALSGESFVNIACAMSSAASSAAQRSPPARSISRRMRWFSSSS